MLIAAALCAVGCGEVGPRFEPDKLLHASNGLTAEQSESIDAALAGLFGTPDEPRLPEGVPGLAELLQTKDLQQAAGPVISHTPGVTQGLYRRHCARCHGVTGDGRGPTARYQAPYPRDFRWGVFKWKSTYRDAPPTGADLHAVLEQGIPGTAMPSFALLAQEEREILRQYVQYLVIRGQTEQALVGWVAEELPADEPLVLDDELREEFFAEILRPLAQRWLDAETQVVTAVSSQASDSIAIGRELYHSERTGCYKCHGQEGQGGAVAGKDYEIDYDLWTLPRVATPESERGRELLASDLPVRPSVPRALIGSTLHGGTTNADLYRRLHQGIAGTPMPALGGMAADKRGSLSDEEVASLALYVETLLAPRLEETEAEPFADSR